MHCPFCMSENVEDSLVCATCARDIAVPPALLAEREDLLRKRELIRGELRAAHDELEAIRSRKKLRSL